MELLLNKFLHGMPLFRILKTLEMNHLFVSQGTLTGGLKKIVELPNEAECRLRSAVVGRKNYYGRGSIWSSALTAALFTILQTEPLPQNWTVE